MSIEQLTMARPTSADLDCGDAAPATLSLAPILVHPDPEEADP